MRLLRFSSAIIVVMFVPVSGLGQQNLNSAHPALAESSATHPAGKITCPGIAASINDTLRSRSLKEGNDGNAVPREISLGHLRVDDLVCGATAAQASGIHFELAKIFFDRTLHSWEFLLQCENVSDCIPFLVRWPRPPGEDPIKRDQAIPARTGSLGSRINPQDGARFLLRRGETVTLVWDQDGIRVVLPAICLEQGNVGESIRVRTKSGGRVFRAEIVNAFLLRVVL